MRFGLTLLFFVLAGCANTYHQPTSPAAALGLALRKAITSPEQEARNMGMGQLCYAHYQAGQDTAPIYAKAIADRGITCTPDMIQMEHDAANRAADRVRRPLSVTCTESRIGNTVSTTCR